MPHDATIRDEALGWAVRAGDPEFAEWEAFMLWLEADPAHAAAYDEISAALADAAETVSLPQAPANDDASVAVPLVRRRWFVGGLAASLALVLGIGVWRATDSRYAVETAPGEFRTVALADGGSVELSGDTRLLLDADDPRFARLEGGQALFSIRHDEANPFAVAVGEDRLVDAGTVFDVRFEGGGMQVAVAEGLVVFNPATQNVLVRPGHMLRRRAGSQDYALSEISPAQVGEWREGRLTFEGAPLSHVAAELSRMTGSRFAAAPSGARTFSGSILIDPVRKDPRSLGALLGAQVRRQDGGWIIEAD